DCALNFLPRLKLWRLDIPPYPSIPLNVELKAMYDHEDKRFQLSTGFLLANIAKAEGSLNVGLSPKIGLSGNMSFDMFYAMVNLSV
ncbi:hypothetical protein A2U01_0071930, partial [Trifolium medium]|nr:hypothetical protein [Trifolium medium]